MSETVSLPFWALVVLLALAGWALYEHLLMPALRWLVAHPANRVIDELSTRLRIGIRPFQRTRRQALIHRLLTDPKVQQAAEQHASSRKMPLNVVLKQVERYAREIVPVGLRMLRLRHLVDEKEGLFSARGGELPLLGYYANSIAHLA